MSLSELYLIHLKVTEHKRFCRSLSSLDQVTESISACSKHPPVDRVVALGMRPEDAPSIPVPPSVLSRTTRPEANA